MVPLVVEVVFAPNARYWGLVSWIILLARASDFSPVSVSASASMPLSFICSISDRSTAPSSASRLCLTFSVASVSVATPANCVGDHSVVAPVFVGFACVGVMRSDMSISPPRALEDILIEVR